MNSENENLSAQQSLDLITSMINQTKGNVQKNSFHFLLWGWVIMIAELGMFILIRLDYPRPYIVWLLPIPAWFISMYYGYRQGKHARVTTHIDRVLMWLWIGFGISVLPVVFFGYKINYHINSIIIISSALPTLLSGIILRFRPLILGGILFWVVGVLCFIVGFDWQFLLAAIAMAAGYLVPGYMMRKKKEE